MVKSAAVSVLVLNYNKVDFLQECFASLEKQTFRDAAYYLVDNNSSDGSVVYTKQHFPWVTCISLDRNYGFSEAYNKAVALIDSEYVVFLNNDVAVARDWLEQLVTAVRNDKKAAAVGSKLLFYHNCEIINSAGIKISPIGVGYDIGFNVKDTQQYNEMKYRGAVCGASMLVRTDIFRELKGFDEDYFAYGEDVDLCWRIWLHGYKVLYCPLSVVYHQYGGTAGRRDSPLRIYHMQKNMIQNVVKNFGLIRLIKALGIISFYSFVRMVLYVLRGNMKNATAVIQGTFFPVKHAGSILKKRREVQQDRALSDSSLSRYGIFASLKESIREYGRICKAIRC